MKQRILLISLHVKPIISDISFQYLKKKLLYDCLPYLKNVSIQTGQSNVVFSLFFNTRLIEK